MTAYRGLAEVYDQFMADGPIQDWLQVLANNPDWLAGKDVADLGCGTGSLLSQLPDVYRSAFGVDNSVDMLAVAASRLSRRNVQWLQQDVRQLVLPKPVHLALATCDVVNYLPSQDDVRLFVQAVRECLYPGGLFLFDVLGPNRLATLQHAAWFEVKEDSAILVDTLVEQGGRISYDVSTFVEEDNGLYRRTDESHAQQYYAQATITGVLSDCGLIVDRIDGEFGRTDVADADRVVFYTRRADD